MTKANSKSRRIKARIAESEAELEAGKPSLPAARLPDAAPPEKFSGLVAEYPGLALAAGIGLGLLAGAVMPRGAGRKLARGAFFLASTGGELGMILGKQALRKADGATREGREKLGETASEAAQQVVQMGTEVGRKAADAGRKAADAGRKAGANAQRAAEDASERARDFGLGLARMALDAASRLRR